MHDTRPMRLMQRLPDLNTVPECFFQWQRPVRKPLRRRFAVDVLHDEEGDVRIPADVVQWKCKDG